MHISVITRNRSSLLPTSITMSSLSSLSTANVQYLQAQGFAAGMIQALGNASRRFPLRVWILDNSARMSTLDAHLLRSDYTQQPASRWQELQACVLYHADLAMRMGWPTRLALVQAPPGAPQQQHLVLHQGHAGGRTLTPAQEFQLIAQTLQSVVPAGPAAILQQLHLLRDYIATSWQPTLQARGQTIPIIIATQGYLEHAVTGQHESGQQLIQMLQSFAALNVSFVLRLTTDEEQAFEFFNALDARIPLPLDVLDDFYGESLEVYLRNPWLCYALVLHRFRELGLSSHITVLDVLDERALTVTELCDFLQFLFGIPFPPPNQTQWPAFLQTIQQCMARERPHWNPVLKQTTPWIDVALLMRMYGPLVMGSAVPTSPSFTQRQQQEPQPASVSGKTPFASPPRSPQQQPHYQAQQPQHNQQNQVPTTTSLIRPTPSHQKPTTVTQLNTALEQTWSKLPPTFAQIKPLAELLATSHETFTLLPASQRHAYFDKFHRFSPDALAASNPKVLQKAVRKVRLFLHPDKLPADLNEMQQALCRTLWDVISEAWNAFQQQQPTTT